MTFEQVGKGRQFQKFLTLHLKLFRFTPPLSQAGRQAGRQVGRQAGRQAARQAGRQAGGHTGKEKAVKRF